MVAHAASPFQNPALVGLQRPQAYMLIVTSVTGSSEDRNNRTAVCCANSCQRKAD